MSLLLNGFALLLVGVIFALIGGLLRYRGNEHDTLLFLLSGISFILGFGIFTYFLIHF